VERNAAAVQPADGETEEEEAEEKGDVVDAAAAKV
jgi:hypothetical protein